MVRAPLRLGAPHARGDGWTGRVAPPRVHGLLLSHARGDGPAPGHADGRTGSVLPTHVGVDVALPHVGMVLRSAPTHVGWFRCSTGGCSPRTWGWSGVSRGTRVPQLRAPPVLPTHVGWSGPDRADAPAEAGINRACSHARGDGPSVCAGAPHARGDGPGSGCAVGRAEVRARTEVAAAQRVCSQCSPRTWGWSSRCAPGCAPTHVGSPRTPAGVLPTHVGMVRPDRATASGLYRAPTRGMVRRLGAPHARGDGPFHAWPGVLHLGWQRPCPTWGCPPDLPCSPRTWGWSAVNQLLPRTGWSRPCGAPHARGDGPSCPVTLG